MITDTHCHVLSDKYFNVYDVIDRLDKDNIKRIIVGKYTFYSNDYVYLQSTQKAIYVKRDFYEFYNNTILREYYDNNTCYKHIL